MKKLYLRGRRIYYQYRPDLPALSLIPFRLRFWAWAKLDPNFKGSAFVMYVYPDSHMAGNTEIVNGKLTITEGCLHGFTFVMGPELLGPMIHPWPGEEA